MKKFTAMLLSVILCFSVIPMASAEGEWVDFKREVIEEDGKCHGVIKAYDGENLLWEYKTDSANMTELESISEIYQNGGAAYFTAHGTLFSLDLLTGALNWSQKGVGASNCFAFDGYGNIYVSGYYGPNVVVFDKNGKRLYIDNNGSYCWVDKLEITGDVLNIHYGLDDIGNTNGMKTLDITPFYVVAQKNDGIKVTLNGEEIEFDQPPVSVDGRTMVPLRAVIEKMGGQIEWLPETSITEIKMNGNKMQLILDSKTAFYNGEPYLMDVAPMSMNNRILLPLRFVAEKFGFGVGWDGETKTVPIVTIPM